MIREMLGIAEGILQDLHNDHREVDALLTELSDSSEPEVRTQKFAELKTKLLPHLRAEQEILYRRLENGVEAESRRFGLEGAGEHRTVEAQLQNLSRLGDPMSTQWEAELKILQDLIDLHVNEEESTGFSCARAEFDSDQLERMGEQFQARKAELMTQVG
jgi:iron-sulfur cluster repair protein YtfE (RIC family)